MELNVVNSEAIEVSNSTFDAPYNEALIHQVVVHCQFQQRQFSKAQKNRSMVRGGGRKPWRQKGTGRARAGTSRSPLWRGGGVTFAKTPGGAHHKLNKKMYRGAIRSIFSELIRRSHLLVVDSFSVDSPKTKTFLEKLRTFDLDDVLIISDQIDENLYLSSRNLPLVALSDVQGITPVSLLAHKKVIMTTAAVKQIEEWLG